ncbi:hypothetical protein FRC01_005616 [Tulasnella sp. 417]|nr:hypothetical protein FRC01_005616 [Tulasnella sp. 417]
MSDTKIEDLDAVEDGRKSPDTPLGTDEDDDHHRGDQPAIKEWFSRDTYSGALLFNVATFILPAIYSTLSKLWIAQLDSTAVATTDTYTYISTFAEVLNEGLPRAAYLVIGDKTRLTADRINLCFTLIAFQMVLGLIMSLGFLGGAERFADNFVPADVRENSITYIRISAFAALTSATTYSASFATRSIDRPDVPLIINTTTTALNLIFDFMFLSTFRIHTKHQPTLNTQAGIRLACDAAGALAGLIYFLSAARRILHSTNEVEVPLCLVFSFALVKPFSKYLSNSDVVADITTRMWKTIDWCYIFYAVNTQLASILLATTPAWYFGNSLVVNFLWVFPWATALQVGIPITEKTAWPYHATIFGGSLVLSFIVTLIILTIWTRRLRAGKMKI